jgi:hypothetical protein
MSNGSKAAGLPGEYIVRIVCQERSHPDGAPVTVATFRRMPDRPNYTGPTWIWDEAKAMGGGPIVGDFRMRKTLHRRRATASERAAGLPEFVEVAPREFVRDLDQSSDQLRCSRCGLYASPPRQWTDDQLERAYAAGVSELPLRFLVSILTRH